MTDAFDPDGLHLPLAALEAVGEAVAEIGAPGFDQALLRALNALAPVDQVAALAIRKGGGAPTAVALAHRADISAARSFTRDYVGGLYVHDPVLAELARRRWTRGVRFHRYDAAGLQRESYRRRFFTDAGVADKIAYLWWAGDVGYYVNLYRRTATGPYAPREAAVLKTARGLVAALVRKHDVRRSYAKRAEKALPPAPVPQALAALLNDRLTAREQDVLSRIIRGMPAEGVALDLGIKSSSVKTLRKRAYAKLGISSQAELFALCVRTMAGRTA